MFRLIYASLLLIVIVNGVICQFYDFLSAFQPIVPASFQYDVTTRPKSGNGQNSKVIENPQIFSIEDLIRTNNKERQKQNSQIDFFGTTTKPRKTTGRNNSDSRNRNKTPKDRNRDSNNNDRIIFDDSKRNTVISYATTKRYQDRETKRTTNGYGTTHGGRTEYPYTIRPGVKPPIANGPPITNRPATQWPSFGPRPAQDDTAVSPELIIGPNEDYMTGVERKRYVELAERMCDKYKALDNKQIQAIPLLPSPDVVRVNVSTCTPTTVPLVVGGKVVTVDEFPHMALLGWSNLRSDGYSWKCGGSLLSNRYVLTAAHCAYQERDNNVVTGAPRAVQLGSSYLDDPNAVIVKVSAVIRHPKYKLPKSYYDIAIIKMATTVTFSNVIKPACLGTPPPPGDPVIVTGWGRTEFGGDQSQELRSVSIPIWDMTECYNALGTSRKIPDGPSSDSQICAGEKRGGKDTCQGDSGGPAQIQDGCTWRVVGVTSLGRSCGAPNTPAIYARVQKAFISAVVFGDQINKNKPTQTTQQPNNQWNQQWNNNQQSNIERNNNQQKVYNTESNSRRAMNNRGGYNDESSVYQSNSNQNDRNNVYYNQNSNGQYYNNGYTTTTTTVRTIYNKPQNSYDDYGNDRIPDYQSDSSSFYSSSGSRTFWR